MEFAEGISGRMDIALNEADVVGVRMGNAPAVVDVLLHVLALPPDGPIDRDPRRVLQLHGVGDLLLLLRRESIDGYGAPLPLRDLDAVEEFFSSLSHQDSMYGWRFFDEPSLVEDWPSDVSLRMDLGGEPSHVFYWFAGCWRGEGDQAEGFCLEGTIAFDQPRVLRADGAEQPVEDFAADGQRWWEALGAHDPRLSTDAQQEWGDRALRWRGRGGTSETGTF